MSKNMTIIVLLVMAAMGVTAVLGIAGWTQLVTNLGACQEEIRIYQDQVMDCELAAYEIITSAAQDAATMAQMLDEAWEQTWPSGTKPNPDRVLEYSTCWIMDWTILVDSEQAAVWRCEVIGSTGPTLWGIGPME